MSPERPNYEAAKQAFGVNRAGAVGGKRSFLPGGSQGPVDRLMPTIQIPEASLLAQARPGPEIRPEEITEPGFFREAVKFVKKHWGWVSVPASLTTVALLDAACTPPPVIVQVEARSETPEGLPADFCSRPAEETPQPTRRATRTPTSAPTRTPEVTPKGPSLVEADRSKLQDFFPGEEFEVAQVASGWWEKSGTVIAGIKTNWQQEVLEDGSVRYGGLFLEQDIEVLVRENIPEGLTPYSWYVIDFNGRQELFTRIQDAQTGEMFFLKANVLIKENWENGQRVGDRFIATWEKAPTSDGYGGYESSLWDPEERIWKDYPYNSPSVGGAENPLGIPENMTLSEQALGYDYEGNAINLRVLNQKGDASQGVIWIYGGVHRVENTGWNTEVGDQPGWLQLTWDYYLAHPEIWKGYTLAFMDVVPGGQARTNSNAQRPVDIQRNFGTFPSDGKECTSCGWYPTKPNERNICSPDGDLPLSEPESQAVRLAAMALKQSYGQVLVAANLHDVGPAVDAAPCLEGDSRSCDIAQELANEMGVPRMDDWERAYGCNLLGEPDAYLNEVQGIPSLTMEFSQRKPIASEVERFCKSLINTIKKIYRPQTGSREKSSGRQISL